MIRAGRNAAMLSEFLENGEASIGFGGASDLALGSSKDEVVAKVEKLMPGARRGQKASAVGQILRFLSEIQVGDEVVTYDPSLRRYYLGSVAKGDASRLEPPGKSRPVQWNRHVLRDGLSAPTRNSLGAILTLFLVPEPAAQELRKAAIAIEEEFSSSDHRGPVEGDGASEPELRGAEDVEAMQEKAGEFIEDRLVQLDWEEMQELVAGVLRGMGYRTSVAPKGADRGVDILASPDGLGLEEPRIFVEVKHRVGSTMGAPDLRKFLGGRQAGDRCLYVSTGGFTREARYEAERSGIPITLVDLPRLRALLVERYEEVDAVTKALVPLQHLYWPAH